MEDKYFCSCCKYNSLTNKEQGSYEICRICFWEDDPIQYQDKNYAAGANNVSLIQAQENFEKFGACTKEAIKYTQKPTDLDLKKK